MASLLKYLPAALIGIVLLAGAVALSSLTPPSSLCNGTCNVILIVVDTLSAKHMSTYGYSRETFPKVSAFFGERSYYFENATANAPWTLPSFASLYYSDLASTITYEEVMQHTRPSLQSVLRDTGYTLRATVPAPTFFITETITQPFTAAEIVGGENNAGIRRAKEELPALVETSRPFFLLVHTFEVHDPYAPTAPYNTYFEQTERYPVVTMIDLLRTNEAPVLDTEKVRWYELRYDQGIAQADENIASFLTSIPQDVLDTSIIILTSDHGEAFGEHGKVWHNLTLYEEELHIPLIIRLPQGTGGRITEPVSLMDIAPTILSLTGRTIPREFKGDDLSPLLQGRSLGMRTIPLVNGRPYYLENVTSNSVSQAPVTLKAAGAATSTKPLIDASVYGLRSGTTKAMYMPPDGWYWFDLATDPGEHTNLAETMAVPQHIQTYLTSLTQ